MPWTTPKTWISEVLTSNDMNTYLSDNTQFLYDEITATLPTDIYTRAGAVNYTTTSTSFVDIDASNMVSTITTTGGDVLVTFTAKAFSTTGTLNGEFALYADGTASEVMKHTILNGHTVNVAFTYTFTGLSAGSHTFRIRFKTDANTLVVTGQYAQWTVRELPQ